MILEDVYSLFIERYKEYTDIQKAAFEAIEKGKNVLIIAQTGSGKTEAAMLPIISDIKKSNPKGVYALYITPLRALNRDLLERLNWLCSRLSVSIEVRHGDTPASERKKQALDAPQIMITTPETLQNLLINKSMREHLKNVRYVVVDELHELYSAKRGAQLSVALERLKEISGNFKRIGISATVGDENSVARYLFGELEYVIAKIGTTRRADISVEMPRQPKKEYDILVKTFGLDKEAVARIGRIAELIKESNAVIVFVNTRQVVESLGNKLIFLDSHEPFGSVGVHHSSLDKEERIRIEGQFKKGEIKAIVSTSSLELGIDIGAVDLVIQYGSPRQVTRFIQRVGRSGHRLDKHSKGVIIASSTMDAAESVAICELAKKGELEKRGQEYLAYDVLMNQIVAMTLEYGKLLFDDLFRIVSRASAYSHMTRQELIRVLEFGNEHKIIKYDGRNIAFGGRTRRYFFEHISVLPDTTRFYVKNVSDGRIISTLDDKFVSNNIEEGTTFITKGMPWNVVNIDGDTIYVEPTNSIDAAIPDWEGEDIPVSRIVAHNAFALIKNGRLNDSNIADSNVVEAIAAASKEIGDFETQLLIEELDEFIVIYAPMGKQANDFFSMVMANIIGIFSKNKVRIKSTPYGIIIRKEDIRADVPIEKLIDIFKVINLDTVFTETEFISKSELFRYRFVQVAKLFGIIEKRAIVTKDIADKLIRFYRNSIVYDETVRDLKKNYLDIEALHELQEDLRKSRKTVSVFRWGANGTVVARDLVRAVYHFAELVSPDYLNADEIKDFKKEVVEKHAEFICTFCGFVFSRKIGEIGEREKIKCEVCGSTMVALHEKADEKGIIEKIRKGSKLKPSERSVYSEMMSSADLIAFYGLRAVISLTTYGIGIRTAARILNMMRKDFDLFISDVLNAQKQFIKTRRYWK
mgnify:CR=1 FL=1